MSMIGIIKEIVDSIKKAPSKNILLFLFLTSLTPLLLFSMISGSKEDSQNRPSRGDNHSDLNLPISRLDITSVSRKYSCRESGIPRFNISMRFDRSKLPPIINGLVGSVPVGVMDIPLKIHSSPKPHWEAYTDGIGIYVKPYRQYRFACFEINSSQMYKPLYRNLTHYIAEPLYSEYSIHEEFRLLAEKHCSKTPSTRACGKYLKNSGAISDRACSAPNKSLFIGLCGDIPMDCDSIDGKMVCANYQLGASAPIGVPTLEVLRMDTSE